ncbi:hypothetical protein C6341_g7597 [Phytophthora cactorum]|nr:hypothetical protein C6341_g7597 [Phytophthora cactorum]
MDYWRFSLPPDAHIVHSPKFDSVIVKRVSPSLNRRKASLISACVRQTFPVFVARIRPDTLDALPFSTPLGHYDAPQRP